MIIGIGYGKKNKEANDAHVPQTVQTDYAKGALALDKEKKGKAYWTEPTELFARAFETYVVDRLQAKARRNDYLSYPMQDEEKQRYPEGKEREAINEAFETLVGELKTRETERGVELYELEAEGLSDFEKFQMVMAADPVKIITPAISKENAKKRYRELEQAVNRYDLRAIRFPVSTFDKIAAHRNRDLIQRAVPQLDKIARESVPIYYEAERNPQVHTNVAGYHNYLNRVEIDGETYFIRLTAREIKDERNELYNVFVSDVEITRTGAGDDISALSTAASNFPVSGSDKMLNQWLDKVKAQAEELDLEDAAPMKSRRDDAPTPAEMVLGRVELKDVLLDALREHYKGQSVERDEQHGGVWIRTTAGRSWYVHAVDHIAVDQAAVELYYGRQLAPGETATARGAYVKGRGIIRLAKDKGTNQWTI